MLLLFLGCSAIISFIKDEKKTKQNYNDFYYKCQNEEYKIDKFLCNKYSSTIKNRDALSTFGYITIIYSSLNVLQMVAPLLIIIVSTIYFHKMLRKGYLINSLTRANYESTLKKIYFKTLRYSLIMPIFLLVIFIISCIISGNFDYKYGISMYGFDAFGIDNYKNIFIFIPIYLLNFKLRSVFWINIAVYNCKYNKNSIVSIIVSYIEYIMLFIIFELIFGNLFFRGSEYMYYFNLPNIWAYTEVSRIGMTCFSTILVVITTSIVYLTYKSKEKIVKELEK